MLRLSLKTGTIWILALVLLLGASGIALADGQQEETEKDDMTIEIWGWGRLIDRVQKHTWPIFQEMYPEAEFGGRTIEEDDIMQRIQSLLQTGEQVPDIIFSNDFIAPTYLSNDLLVPLEDYIDMSQFVGYKVENASWEGTAYGVPHDPSPVVRIYRQDLYEQAGVDPTEVETWDDFIEAGKKLREIDVYAWNLPREGMWFQWYEIVLNSLGGQFFDEDLNVAIDSSEAVEALEILEEMKESGITNDFGDDRSQGWFAALQEGRLATIMHAPWYVGTAMSAAPDTAGNWRATDLPDRADGESVETFVGGSGLYVVRGHNTDIEVLADFMRAFAESQLAIYKDSGIMTAYKPHYDDDVFQAESEFFGGQQYNAFLLEQADRVPKGVKNYPPQRRQVEDVVEQQLTPFFEGDKSAEQTIADMAAAINDVVR